MGLGTYPDGWVKSSLFKESIVKARIGWQGLTAKEYLDYGPYGLVGGTDFISGFINWGSISYVEKYRFDQDLNIQLNENDVLITKDGTIGKVAIVKDLPIPSTLNSGVYVVRPVNSNYDPKFIYFLLTSNVFSAFIEKLAAGSTISHLYQRDLKDFEVTIPNSINEQKIIAKVLSDIDKLIEGLKLEIAKSLNLKESVCRPLVLGQKRLTGFNNNWSQKLLGDELGYEQPTKYLVNTNEHQESGNVPVLTAGKTFILGYSDDTEGIYSNIPTILFDDFTTDSKYVDFDFKVKSSACKMLQNTNPKANLRFFHTLMQYLEFRPYDHKRYWISEYSKLEISVPDATEQNAIAGIIEDFDNQVKSLKSELAKYECIKQGVAHDLLTGKVRLV